MSRVILTSSEGDFSSESFSEWRLPFQNDGGHQRVVVNAGFQNRDFRTKHGISVIDPEAYEGLRKAQISIFRAFQCKLLTILVLSLILFFSATLIPIKLALTEESDPSKAYLAALIGSNLLTFVMYHYISKILFKNADNKVIALVESYKVQFLDLFGVELGHRPSTKSPRWSSDDSGIYLRRPRRQEPTPPAEAATSVEGQTITMSNSESVEIPDAVTIPPIFVGLVIPGDLHVDEKSYDASMKVDATAWALLQKTHREMIPLSRTMRAFHLIYCVVVLIFIFSASVALFIFPSVLLIILCALVVGVTYVLICVFDRRNLRIYQEVSQRVTEGLQKEDGSSDLVVEFTSSELPGRVPENFRRYQFVRTLATRTGPPPTTEIV